MNLLKAKKEVFSILCKVVKDNFNVDIYKETLYEKFEEPPIGLTEEPSDVGQSLTIPMFTLSKFLLKGSKNIQEECVQLSKKIEPLFSKEIQNHSIIEKIECSEGKPYINIFYKSKFLGDYLYLLNNGSYIDEIPKQEDVVMVEYSQPNTHKTFHVGHMRNASLGMSIVKLLEFNKFKTIAVNYIGDIGTHIAKCLWYYLNFEDQTKTIDENVPKFVTKVEYLGNLYAKADSLLDMSLYTKLCFPGVYSFKIIEIQDHPSNPKQKIVKVTNEKDTFSVVCGGTGYNLGDIIAYVPVGSKKGGKTIIEADFKGVKSSGLIMSELELELGKNKDKIYIFPKDTPLGVELTEIGRVFNCPKEIKSISLEIKSRNEGVRNILKKMEDKDETMTKLWEKTRRWCLDEFKEIYSWVDCRFDHYFHESDVGDESKEIVIDAFKKGLLEKSEGAIGLNCGKQYGFCVLLTSDGTGLYATKDIALAKRKFEDFKVDRNVYVVDVAQSLHFQQVFKVLEKLEFKQAKKCLHLPYGIVVLPEGRMSSRKGNIITFSMLKDQLIGCIMKEYLEKYKGKWVDGEIDEAAHRIAVAIIKYGMLKMDSQKDITFILNEWSAKTGNTGPYLLYAYARTRSILREVTLNEKERLIQPDFSLLTHPKERKLLLLLNSFLYVTKSACEQYKPHLICNYLFCLAKNFSRMYEEVSVKNAESSEKVARLFFINCIGIVLKQGLDLLGIKTLERM